MMPASRADRTGESDERERREAGGADSGGLEPEDNSLGRLLTLSDGVFAIAMTLLALDLAVPTLGDNPGDATLRHALGHQSDTYLSFALSFYVIAGYWQRHRALMHAVVSTHPSLIRKTIVLLFIVAAMPFFSSLLGRYAGTPIALACYGLWNAGAILILLQLRRDVRRFELRGHDIRPPDDRFDRRYTLRNLAVFLLCAPAGFVLGHHGPWVLVLLAVPIRVPRWARLRRSRAQADRARTRR